MFPMMFFFLTDFLLVPYWWYVSHLWWGDNELILLLHRLVFVARMHFILAISWCCWRYYLYWSICYKCCCCYPLMCCSWFELMTHYVDGWWDSWWCGYICCYYILSEYIIAHGGFVLVSYAMDYVIVVAAIWGIYHCSLMPCTHDIFIFLGMYRRENHCV